MLFLLFISSILLSFSGPIHLMKKVMGHWATNDDMSWNEAGDTIGKGDTLTFTKMKFDEKLYHWGGGYLAGIEFKPDSQFTQYQNVFCSDETDTKVGFEEKYFFIKDSIVEVKSDFRNFRFKVLYVDSKKLRIKILGPVN